VIIAITESSEGSSSEVNSLVSFATTENIEGKKSKNSTKPWTALTWEINQKTS
jgi:hypothetical protein